MYNSITVHSNNSAFQFCKIYFKKLIKNNTGVLQGQMVFLQTNSYLNEIWPSDIGQ